MDLNIHLNILMELVFHTTSGAFLSGPPTAYLNVVTVCIYIYILIYVYIYIYNYTCARYIQTMRILVEINT